MYIVTEGNASRRIVAKKGVLCLFSQNQEIRKQRTWDMSHKERSIREVEEKTVYHIS